MKETRFADMVTAVAIMLLAAYWFFEANKMAAVEFGIGSGGYPKFVSAGFFFVGFLLLITSIRKGLPKPQVAIDKKALLRIVVFVAVTFVYVLAMRYLGFLLLTPLYLFFACCFFAYKRKVIAAVASVVVTAALYLVFAMIFYVPLPAFRLF
jgi:hypothetical protein